MRWFAGLIYGGLVAFVWTVAGVGTALLVLALALFLTATMRIDLMADWAAGWAEWFAQRRRTRSRSSEASGLRPPTSSG